MPMVTDPMRVPAAEVPARPPLYDQFLYLGLCRVFRGEIGATSRTGIMRHRTDELPVRLVSALFVLHRDGFIALREEPDRRDGWYAARLTRNGVKLLADWGGPVRRHPGQPGQAGQPG